MSAKSLAKLAADRDTTPPGQSVVKDSTDVLVAAVPTEALAAYTAVIGVVLAANIGSAYAPFRWCAYAAFIALAVLAPLSLFQQRSTASTMESRKLPIPECLTAGTAAAAWGLVMPGNPLALIIQGNVKTPGKQRVAWVRGMARRSWMGLMASRPLSHRLLPRQPRTGRTHGMNIHTWPAPALRALMPPTERPSNLSWPQWSHT